jgi:hypothetical protein
VGDCPNTTVEVNAAALGWGIHHAILGRSTARPTTSRGSRHDPLPFLLLGLSTCLHCPLLVYGGARQVIVRHVGGLDQTVLQLDGKPLAEEVGFLLINVDTVGPILGKGVELSSIVIHSAVPLLQVKELLQLAT